MKKAVATLAAVSLLVADVAWAGGPVADPAAAIGFRPTVQAAPNGVPTVNIVNPSAGGVSHNKYTSFDVDPQGAVLNNSMTSGTSVLAGALNANPNLTMPAQVILNEVTGTGASQLNGPTEVFGPAANVIVANPNGISVDGGSFINSPRVTLTTGTPIYGGLGAYEGLGFSVQGGQLNVSGSGLDGSGIGQVDLVGRRVVVDGAVSGAAALNVTGGGADYAYATGTATNAAAPAQAGAYAIDASALGAMNAGQVKLIGTEAGIGVRALGGVAASAGDVTITSTGQIVVNGASASRDVALSGTDISAGGSMTAARALGLAASQAATTSGTHTAQDVSVTAGTTAALGATTTATSLTASAGGALSHTGATTLTGGNATLSGAGVTTSGTLATDRDVGVTSTAGATLGAATSARDLTASATGALATSGSTNLTGAASLSGGTVTTAGILSADGAVGVTAGTDATLGGSVTARGNLTATAGNALAVNGTVAADGNATANAASVSVASAGALSAGGAVAVTATGAMTNAGVLDAGAGLSLNAGSLDNTGRASAATALNVTTTGALANTAGQMAGDSIGITAGGALTNTTGSITGTNGVTVAAASVGNRQGFLRSTTAGVSVTTAGALDNTQGAIAGTGIGITAGSVDNSAGEAIATGNLAVTTTSGALVNRGGTLFANGTNTLTSAAGMDNTAQGSVGAIGQLAVGAQGTMDNTGGTMVGNDRVTVTTPGQIIQGGNLTAAGDITATAGTVTNRGYTASATALSVSAGTIVNETGQLTANDGVALTATGLVDNRAQIASGVDVGVVAGSLSNSSAGRIEANRNLTAATTGAMANAGILAANGTLALSAGTTLTNTRGTMLSGGAMDLLAGTALTNEAGTIQSGGDMAVRAGTRMDNRRGAINGSTQQSESTGAATLSSGGTLLLQAPIVRNEASLMASAGNMTVTATTFENVVHSLLWRTTYSWQSCSRTWYGRSKCHTNYGYSDSYSQTPSLVYAGGTLALTAPTITNTGTIQANRVNAVANVMTNGIVDWTIKTMPAAVPSARIDLTQYAALPEATPGLFDLSRDPASRYVVTTTINVANLIDPDALNARLGQAAAPSPRFFADPFAETTMLQRAALAQTGQRFFVPQATTDEQQRQALYDNAVAFAAGRTDVKLGVSFSDSQLAA
ncbi:MAG: filamentous hemagglutinin N-terminal domain-containing protein, partial [Rhodospirillaceae bacterium]|nr:filamentous hemagglutinin N-terminal domain-containing protein [Rhodospirillales bacterium]